MTSNTKIYTFSFRSVYLLYIQKVEKKWYTKQEVDTIILWLTWYNMVELENIIQNNTNFLDFFWNAPRIHPNVSKITGSICGYKIQEISDPLMQKIRYLDKLIDELAKWKSMEKILRK